MPARVQDIFLRPGEWVAAGQPVLALLPPANRKARFYVPQSVVGGLKLDAPVQLHCDGCGAAIPARISFIANGPEYTPPVIYSNQQRDKLVFLVEARPVKAEDAERLHPGQPLDVSR
jgi:HlyD family secretion protein